MIMPCSTPHGCGCAPDRPSGALAPPATVLIKLGSLAVHADELLSPSGHEIDTSAIKGLLADPEVRDWLKEMDKMAFLPVKR